MADKLLKSIKFPTLPDRYVIGDASLSEEGAAADAKATGDAIADLKSEIDEVQDICISQGVNLYDPSLQTADTISPHYFFNGEPYSTTAYDYLWNCTALIPVEPNTTYTVGLVPPYGNDNIVKPWNTAGQGGFCYDANGDYLTGVTGSMFTTSTFTTPANCHYIRFNYYKFGGVTLDVLNARCMLVKGSALPNDYSSYQYTTLKIRMDAVEQSMLSKPIWYRRTGTTLEVGYPYSDDKKVIVTMKEYGGNNLFDLKAVETISASDSYESGIRTSLLDSPSDCFGPYVVGAVNNIDGDDPTSTNFTGGQHQYNNQGSGSTPTARTASIIFLADTKTVSDGDSGYCLRLEAYWTNYVQGYNTRKADGTGREILKVKHSALFNGIDMKVSTNIFPLEDVVMKTFYGFQGYAYPEMYPKVRYLDSSNRTVNVVATGSDSSNSGDLIGYIVHAEDSSNANYMEISIDPIFDLGRRAYAGNNPAMFISWYKIYFSIIRTDVPMALGTEYSLRGAYKFAPAI